ncbi:MAG: cytochrome d ubiquinol oxidase subunit II, partial [Elusimicrobia bacterium]|nr:cytochrome d ubiquinol oxidase subunit II [Candidatus Obscuribacterium magneticum]
MFSWENISYSIIVLSLAVYAVTGGADFGSGIWSLFLKKSESPDGERLINKAMSPVWEAN